MSRAFVHALWLVTSHCIPLSEVRLVRNNPCSLDELALKQPPTPFACIHLRKHAEVHVNVRVPVQGPDWCGATALPGRGIKEHETALEQDQLYFRVSLLSSHIFF